ncbi:MAG TPA: PQQ-binding-like beta-propeller repeat protein [Actinomycetota bacterium]
MTLMQGRHAAERSPTHRLGFTGLVVLLLAGTAAVASWRFGIFSGASPEPSARDGDPPSAPTDPGEASPEPSPSPSSTPEPINTGIEGLTTFRGNATRTYHGRGPVPEDPEILWRYPTSGGLCGQSSDAAGTRLWCGTGWTGQPNVVEWEGRIQIRFGAYDYAVHVVGGRNGRALMEPFRTGDLIKGTVTSDPDGYPLLYVGSRDNQLRILALDRGRTMEELWSLSADSAPDPTWNDDWDGSPLVIDDYLLEGGENSWFYVVKLNRGYDGQGRVTVNPRIRVMVPGYDDELIAALGDEQVSIESSVAFHDGVAYFANSGGLVQGWDVSDVLLGGDRHRRVFRFWTGDDTDASVVIDEEGYLYVASELERLNGRSREVGQLMKLDPRKPKDPLVWSVPVPGEGGAGGLWATPAVHGRLVIAPTNTGRILAVNRNTGRIRWELRLPPPTWTSPVIVDDVLILGDCAGVLHAYDLSRPGREPPELWSVQLEGCIESTPAVWDGMVYVGARGGAVYGIGDRG